MTRQHWQGGTVPGAKRLEKQTERLPTEKLPREAGHEDSAKIEKGAPDFHR
jgi:hypothetical protein